MSTAPVKPNPSDPMFAVFNGREEITEEMYKEVQSFAEHVKELQKKNPPRKNRDGKPLLHN